MPLGRFYLASPAIKNWRPSSPRANAFVVATEKTSIRRDCEHRLQENEENGFFPAAYRRSNLGQAAIHLPVRMRQTKFTASLLRIGPNRPFPAGSTFSAGPARAAQVASTGLLSSLFLLFSRFSPVDGYAKLTALVVKLTAPGPDANYRFQVRLKP